MRQRNKKKAPLHAVLPAWRRWLLLGLIVFSFAGLLGRGLYLQTVQADFLQERSAARIERDIELQAYRGRIFDRNNVLLAGTTPVETVSVNPQKVVITDAQLRQLSALLNIDKKRLSRRINRKNKVHVNLKRRIDPQLANKVMALKIPGIDLQREYKRYYPKGEEFAHVVGLQGLGENKQNPNEGFVGLELQFNEWLKGKNGNRTIVRTRDGRVVEDLKAIIRPKDGRDMVLSLDQSIQHLAYNELLKGVEKAGAVAGSAVVLDAKTGEVLAMVNVPSYNPNNSKGYKGSFKNTTVSDVFEPGSTMKAFSVAAGIESGEYSPTTKIDTGNGHLKFIDYTIHDTKPHGVISVSEVIKMSSNIGTSKIAKTLGKKALWETYKKMAFGQKTNIEFPGEATGVVRHYDQISDVGLATMSYGNGVSVTLLQMARAYTVFANDGVLMPVTLKKLKRVPVGEQVFSSKTARQLKAMLETVVSEEGTAKAAMVSGYRVAGKTGTSRKVGASGHYEKGKYISSFVGLAPASDPKLIIAIKIDEPSTAGNRYYGGAVAGPIFSEVMRQSLTNLLVPKDLPVKNIVLDESEKTNTMLADGGAL